MNGKLVITGSLYVKRLGFICYVALPDHPGNGDFWNKIKKQKIYVDLQLGKLLFGGYQISFKNY